MPAPVYNGGPGCCPCPSYPCGIADLSYLVPSLSIDIPGFPTLLIPSSAGWWADDVGDWDSYNIDISGDATCPGYTGSWPQWTLAGRCSGGVWTFNVELKILLYLGDYAVLCTIFFQFTAATNSSGGPVLGTYSAPYYAGGFGGAGTPLPCVDSSTLTTTVTLAT